MAEPAMGNFFTRFIKIYFSIKVVAIYFFVHGQGTFDESFFKNIPNNWPIWADGPNKFALLCGAAV